MYASQVCLFSNWNRRNGHEWLVFAAQIAFKRGKLDALSQKRRRAHNLKAEKCHFVQPSELYKICTGYTKHSMICGHSLGLFLRTLSTIIYQKDSYMIYRYCGSMTCGGPDLGYQPAAE